MNLHLSRTHQRQLLEWAEQAGRHECCGLLLGRDEIVESLELTRNVADDTTTNFEIDPSALIAAEKRARKGGLQILGYFHSHPNGNGQLSQHDIAMAAADGRRWLIIADNKIFSWRPIGGFFAAETFVDT